MTIPTVAELIAKYSNLPVTELAFYIPGTAYAQDSLRLIEGEYVGFYSGKTLEQYRQEHPTTVIASYDEIARYSEDLVRRPVEEISAERYHDMLEMLPPVNWRLLKGESSFKFMERHSGNMTNIFASITTDVRLNPNDPDSKRVIRYFEMLDNMYIPHDEIINRCREYMNSKQNISK